MSSSYPVSFYIRIFVPFALGYFISYLFRVINAVIAGDLSHDLSINAEQLGLLTSAYLITFAAFQFPLGILLDKFGPRRVEATLLLVSAVGALIFAYSQSFAGLMFGRSLIGLGVSACLMGAFKALVQWFPSERLPLANGILLTSGGIGILMGSTPVEWALTFTDWRGIFVGLSAFTALVAATLWLAVPDKHSDADQSSWWTQIFSILAILKDRRFWCLTPLSTACQGTAIATIGLWTGPWLRDVALLGRSEAAWILLFLGAGILSGFLLTGWVAQVLLKKGISTMTTACMGMAMFIVVQILIVAEWTAFSLYLWIAYGLFSTSGMLTYAVLSQSYPKELAGRVNTCFNALVFFFAFAAQWGIGAIIEKFTPQNFDPVRYHGDGYQVAFGFLVLLQIICLIAFALKGRRTLTHSPT